MHTNITRRTFGGVLAGAFAHHGVAQAGLKARVKIDTERQIGAIDPMLFGSNVEHIGRCVYGGIFDEGSPLSDASSYRKDVMDAVKRLHPTSIRHPGGNFASTYHWQDGIGPRENRPQKLELNWGTTETNNFGTHEFLDYTEMIGAEPYLTVNLGTGSWDEAQRWVEYTNHSGETDITSMRKRNGREKPWNVKYWGLGNEMDMPFQMGQRSADDYGKFALQAAKLMSLTDPEILLVAAGASNFFPGANWVEWNRTVLRYLKGYIDYLSLHSYIGNLRNDYHEFLASSLDFAERTEITHALIQAALAEPDQGPVWPPGLGPKPHPIFIAWDEWNVWYRADPAQRGRSILEEHYNLEDALVIATVLNTFINHANIVKLANMCQLVNVTAPIFTSETGLYLQTTYYPMMLFANNARGKALDLFVESPTYKTRNRDAVPYLDISAALEGRTLVLNIVNRHKDQSIDCDFTCDDKSFNGSWTATEVNGPDIKAENGFGATKVRAERKPIAASGKTLRLQLPPHSYTMLKGEIG